MKEIIRLIRPHQWIKNLVVLFPIFFGKALGNIESLYEGCITMIAFSFIASSIYCLNDIVDVADDRRHPKKCNRPLASGKISIAQGYAIMGIMVILSMVSVLFLPQQRIETGGVIGFYWALNVAYCLYLKQHAIIDVCIVAFGFVLRILAGGMATDIRLSKWIVLMTFLLMLFSIARIKYRLFLWFSGILILFSKIYCCSSSILF